MSAIPPNTNLDGFIQSMKDGVEGAFRKGVKHGRYLEQQERISADAVFRDEYEALLRRFRHLIESDFIRSFDEYDPRTQTYKRDISDADAFISPVRCERCRAWDKSVVTSNDESGWCHIMMQQTRPDFYCGFGPKLVQKDATQSNMID